jgi:hypothetical protein
VTAGNDLWVAFSFQMLITGLYAGPAKWVIYFVNITHRRLTMDSRRITLMANLPTGIGTVQMAE